MAEHKPNEKLISARIEAGHSQRSLAKELLINEKTVGRWETDFVIPHPDTQKKVGKALGKSPKELGFEDRPRRKSKRKQDISPAFSPSSSPICQYVVNMTYEQALSHGIMPSEDTVQHGSEERGEQEDDMDKRQFLVQGKNILAAGVVTGIIGDVPLSNVTIPAEEFLPQCAISLKSCWRFLDVGSLDMTEQIIEVNLPTLLSLTITPSKHQQAAATLMTQAKIIQSIIAGHQLNSKKEMYCLEAIKWSQLSGDVTIMAAALMHLGCSYTYYFPRKPQQGIEKLTQALHILGDTPTLLKSVIYVTLADAYAQQAKEQETLKSIALATENYPEYPEHDPHFLLADCSKGSLKDRQGRALNRLASRLENTEHYTQASNVLDDSLALERVPRGRIDTLVGKLNAALGLRNLDTYTKYAQETVFLAASTESKWNYTQLRGIHEQIPEQWRHEQAIRNLEGVFASVHKTLFSPQTV